VECDVLGATQGWLQSIKIDICGWRPCIAGLVATPRTAASFFVSLFVFGELSSWSLAKVPLSPVPSVTLGCASGR
jgi:hypothetical protein